MKKTLASLAIAALVGGVGTATAAAGPGKSANAPGQCISAGLGTLNSLGATSAAARQQLDYAPFDSSEDGAGLIRLDLGEEAFLPLSTVIGLHRTNPELFAWCD